MKTGRNSPCPCGSGRKSKNCCGATRETLPKDPPGSELAYLAQAMGAHAHLTVETRARELLQLYPGSGILWKSFSISLAMQEKPALEPLEMAARLLPEDADTQFNYGHALRGPTAHIAGARSPCRLSWTGTQRRRIAHAFWRWFSGAQSPLTAGRPDRTRIRCCR